MATIPALTEEDQMITRAAVTIPMNRVSVAIFTPLHSQIAARPFPFDDLLNLGEGHKKIAHTNLAM
jgi:hypothetical protein